MRAPPTGRKRHRPAPTSSCAWRTPGSAWTARRWSASSSPSSPPRRSARAPGSACRRSMGSSCRAGASSESTARRIADGPRPRRAGNMAGGRGCGSSDHRRHGTGHTASRSHAGAATSSSRGAGRALMTHTPGPPPCRPPGHRMHVRGSCRPIERRRYRADATGPRGQRPRNVTGCFFAKARTPLRKSSVWPEAAMACASSSICVSRLSWVDW